MLSTYAFEIFILEFYIWILTRQKSSGAEGERLKEATNINKSLSTLGYVFKLLSYLKFVNL